MGCTSSTPANGPSGAKSPETTASSAAPSKGTALPPTSTAVATKTDLPHTFSARYKLGDILGEGGYSVVKLGISNIDKKKVAVKIVTRNGLSADDEESLRAEVRILTDLNHPNIVRAFDFFEEEKYFYVVLEYLDGGELFDRIVKKTFYNEKEARDLVVVLLRAIKYLHDGDVIHRDLKPENLIMTSKNDDANVKLADFGFAAKVDGFNITTQCGTPGYIAPEIIETKPYGKPVDMWSFGVILYILLGGYPPFHDDNQRVLFRKIVKGDYAFHPDYWKGVSEEAKDLIRGLLNLDMTKRLTVDQALAHSWVKAADEMLAARNLEANLAELRKYQATRKLRAGVKAVMAINRMKNLIGDSSARHSASEKDKESSASAAEPTAAAAAEDASRI